MWIERNGSLDPSEQKEENCIKLIKGRTKVYYFQLKHQERESQSFQS